VNLGKVDYASTTPPRKYQCADCGARGVKLWREMATFLGGVKLRCFLCAGRHEVRNVASIDADGCVVEDGLHRSDQIGGLGPAVPTPEGDTFWGYSSVPNAGARWWRCLPNMANDKPRVLPPAPPDIPKPDYSTRWEQWQRETAYVVEATSCEQLTLWSEWHKLEPREKRFSGPFAPNSAPWEQMSPGCGVTVGEIVASRKKRPVCLSLMWARIHGHLVLFWHPTSQLVDYDRIEAWLTKNVPAYARGRRIGAMNFHICIQTLERMPTFANGTSDV
jgi:hypothetical protein